MDMYFNGRLNTSPRSEPRTSGLTAAIAGSQHASSTALRSPTLPPQAEEPTEIPIQGEGQLISHAGASRQPTVVHRVDTRHKSSEGLLNTFNSQGSNTLLNKQVAREDEDRTPDAVSGLRVLCYTDRAPGLPFVTAAGTSDAELARLRAAVRAACADDAPEARALRLNGVAVLPPEAYAVIRDMRDEAVAANYPELA